MEPFKTITFKSKIAIIGVNPFVFLPKRALNTLFKQAGKERSPIPVKGTINGQAYKQNLVRHLDVWRLYINTTMLKKSPERIGELIEVSISFDPDLRTIETPAGFTKALEKNKEARLVFEQLSSYMQKEIVRYLAKLKTQESLEKNIDRAINFLLGKERFIGRDKP